MPIVLCPGFHPPQLTQNFIQAVGLSSQSPLVFPAEREPAYSPVHLLRFLHQSLPAQSSPVTFIAFSAGVVGAIATARLWQRQGGEVAAFFALDGWGVPLAGDFPIHRLSHDRFTHWSSTFGSIDQDSFYADPGVGHLDLWSTPQIAQGWWVCADRQRSPYRTTAASFMTDLLGYYKLV